MASRRFSAPTSPASQGSSTTRATPRRYHARDPRSRLGLRCAGHMASRGGARPHPTDAMKWPLSRLGQRWRVQPSSRTKLSARRLRDLEGGVGSFERSATWRRSLRGCARLTRRRRPSRLVAAASSASVSRGPPFADASTSNRPRTSSRASSSPRREGRRLPASHGRPGPMSSETSRPAMATASASLSRMPRVGNVQSRFASRSRECAGGGIAVRPPVGSSPDADDAHAPRKPGTRVDRRSARSGSGVWIQS